MVLFPQNDVILIGRQLPLTSRRNLYWQCWPREAVEAPLAVYGGQTLNQGRCTGFLFLRRKAGPSRISLRRGFGLRKRMFGGMTQEVMVVGNSLDHQAPLNASGISGSSFPAMPRSR